MTTSPAKYVKEVRQEASKVTWPNRKETTASTIMVLIMVFVMALFFLFVDWVISSAVQFVLGL
jgi:preprotein translocase subunit SecE